MDYTDNLLGLNHSPFDEYWRKYRFPIIHKTQYRYTVQNYEEYNYKLIITRMAVSQLFIKQHDQMMAVKLQ